MKKLKAYGWVIEDTEDHFYLSGLGNASSLRSASVYLTRVEARRIKKNCLSGDIIRKVSLNRNGRAVAVVPRR